MPRELSEIPQKIKASATAIIALMKQKKFTKKALQAEAPCSAATLRSSDKTQFFEAGPSHRTLTPKSEADDAHRQQVPGILDFD
jgi:hypothetical protein